MCPVASEEEKTVRCSSQCWCRDSYLVQRNWLRPNITLYLVTTMTAHKKTAIWNWAQAVGWKCNKQNSPFFLRTTSTLRLIDWLVFGDHDIATVFGTLLEQLQPESFVYCSHCYTTFFFQNAKKSLVNLKIWKWLNFKYMVWMILRTLAILVVWLVDYFAGPIFCLIKRQIHLFQTRQAAKIF